MVGSSGGVPMEGERTLNSYIWTIYNSRGYDLVEGEYNGDSESANCFFLAILEDINLGEDLEIMRVG
jgi:hypothetical protein